MTTEELAELFLAHLYELADEAPHPNFLFSVNDFVPKLGITDREEVQKAINYLGDGGFIILASFDMLGGISAGITIEGSIFVEKGGETGIIEQYRKNPQTLARTPSESSPLPIHQVSTETVTEEKQSPFFARRGVEAILEDIEDILERDDTVAADDKKDLLSDLATLKIQMGRNVKSRQIIHVVLGNLSNIPSIAPLVTGLNHIVETYFR
ncbi:MAG: hypothetical protein MUP41_18825 [Desulfobacterales bacterium]|nr:hypothetical protein [Desulfobacterales bacterium]